MAIFVYENENPSTTDNACTALETINIANVTKVICYYKSFIDATDNNYNNLGANIKAGTKYYGGGHRTGQTYNQIIMAYLDEETVCYDIPQFDDTDWYYAEEYYMWTKVILDIENSQISVYRSPIQNYGTSNNDYVYGKSLSYTQFGTTQSISFESSTVTELNLYRYDHTSEPLAVHYEVHTSTTEGGSATLTNIRSITALQTLSGGGQATIICDKDPHNYTVSDYTDNARQSITLYDQNGALRFKGEIDKIKVGYDKVTYIAQQDLRKLNDMHCDYNPVAYKSNVLRVDSNELLDEFAGWTTNEHQGKILAITDTNRYRLYEFPSQAVMQMRDGLNTGGDDNSWIAPDVDATETGDVDYLYFNDQTKTDDRNSLGGFHDDSIGNSHLRLRYNFTFNLYLKDTPTFDSIKLRIIWRLTSLVNSHITRYADIPIDRTRSYARLRLYDYQAGDWDTEWIQPYSTSPNKSEKEGEEDWQDSTLQGLNDKMGISPIFDTTIDLLSELDEDGDSFYTKYLNLVASANSAGFSRYSLQLSLESNYVDSDIPLYDGDPKFEIYLAELELDHSLLKQDPQTQIYSNGLIASNTDKKLTLDGTESWELSTFPQGDGVTKNDVYYITEQMDTVLDTIFAKSKFTSKNWSISHSIDVDGKGETEDLTDVPVLQYLQKVKRQVNGVIYSDSNDSLNIVVLRETPIDSGLTINHSEIINFKKAFEVEYDYSFIKENIKAVGNMGIRKTATNVPAVDNALGDEDIIYYDNELSTGPTVQDMATQKANRHLSVQQKAPFQLDPSQADYSLLKEGKTFTLTITDSNSVVQYTDTLLVDNIQYVKEGNKEFLFVTAEKRF